MSSLSIKNLLKLRSGQTVWRVWGYASHTGEIRVEVSRYAVLGKKVLHWFSKGPDYPHSAMRMEHRRKHKFEDNFQNENYARFLADLLGFGCFSSMRAAHRFANDITAGLYPNITNFMIQSEENDRQMDEWDHSLNYEDFVDD